MRPQIVQMTGAGYRLKRHTDAARGVSFRFHLCVLSPLVLSVSTVHRHRRVLHPHFRGQTGGPTTAAADTLAIIAVPVLATLRFSDVAADTPVVAATLRRCSTRRAMNVDVNAWSALEAMYQYDESANAICSQRGGEKMVNEAFTMIIVSVEKEQGLRK